MRTGAILAALTVASTAYAHATFQYLWVNGVDEGSKCARTPANNSPITDLTSKASTHTSIPTCPVAAGTKVAVEMHQHNDRDCTKEAIGGNHDGPTIIYMAKVESAATAVGSEANWFKVAETGLVSNDYWGTDVMNANCGKVEFTIPSDISAGNYLIRAEVIALHVAGSAGGAQLYMSCYQINVTGGGAISPPTVKFPGAYSATDPGILFNINSPYTNYTIPGPPLHPPGGAYGGPAAVPTTPVSTSTTNTTNGAEPPVNFAGGGYGGPPDAPVAPIASTSTTTTETEPAGGAYGGPTPGASTTSIAAANSVVPTTTEATSSSTTTTESYAPPESTDTSSYADSSTEIISTSTATGVTSLTSADTAAPTPSMPYPTDASSTSAAEPAATSVCKGSHRSRKLKRRRTLRRSL
ncbi:glycoside hydrolase family 61 protein [Rhizoctonia solani 123E]|uniref:AA9 family lytic polysaccharide monooxygenase n=1 Tax=Rhizoctonia solani 123E TaxID=1423351 RepID=A0A074SCS7_9AGAM|nr:glycoside hydrolase family 61 protein [Rhizoctonia solani 123E]